MTDREQIIFERALCLCANEYGRTREQMLAWLGDDAEDWRTDYPKDKPVQQIAGIDPFIMRTRRSNVKLPPADKSPDNAL